MRKSAVLAGAVALAGVGIGGAARGDVFGPGPGGLIPDSPEVPPGAAFVSAISVPNLGVVSSLNSVTLNFDPPHTWVGDLVITLRAPNGDDVHVIARTGATEPDDVGGGADLIGPYTFVNGPGSPGLWTTVASGPSKSVVPSGTYPRETLHPMASPPAGDPDNYGVFNGDPVGGNWTLTIQDWEHFDSGGLSSWSLDVTPVGPPVTPTWAVNGSGDWNAPGNWTGGVPNGVGEAALFGPAITAPRTVYTDTGVTVGTLVFNNASTYVLAGAGSLAIDVATGTASINVQSGSHKINLPLFVNDNTTANVSAGATLTIADPLTITAGRTLTKSGPGTLRVISTVSGGSLATIDVSGGEAHVDFGIGTPASGSAAADAQVGLTVSGAAKARFNANQTLRRLDAITASAGDQEIDLGGRLVRVYAPDRAAEELSIYNDIKAARLSTSGRDGIYDSTSPGVSAGYAIGVTDQSTDAHGDPSVLVRLTREGDANLDGNVTLQDFNRLATFFGQTNQRWDNGDFNFDGNVNLQDFNRLAAQFGRSAAGTEVTPQDWASLASAVPEPAGGAAVLLTGLGSLARRRRRRRAGSAARRQAGTHRA